MRTLSSVKQCEMLLIFTFVSVLMSLAASGIVDIDSNQWPQLSKDHPKLMIIFYKLEGCDACTAALSVLSQVDGQPELPSDIVLSKTNDAALAQHFKVTTFPTLIFLRDDSQVAYDDVYEIERLLEWIQLAYQRSTHSLDDTSFEHLTQASSGATTGDWLVAFYTDSCDGVLSVVESFGVRLKNRINVAKVNIGESPVLVERFRISKCPEIIYFKQGRMYRYDIPSLDVPSLRSFVDTFYRNIKAEVVPVPKSKFDYLTEDIADLLKKQLNSENRNLILIGAGGAAVVLFLVTVLCCCCGSSDKTKQKTE